MSKSYAKNYEMKPNHLYFSYETGRIILYLKSDDNKLILMQNEHNVFVNVKDNEYLKTDYIDLGIADPEFINIQLKILDKIHSTIAHTKKAFVVAQLAKMVSDEAPDLEVTVGKDMGLPNYMALNIYNTIKDIITNDENCPFKIVPINETNDGIDFKVVFDDDKVKNIMESNEYKEFERHVNSINPKIGDIFDSILDAVTDDELKRDKIFKDSSDMII